MQKRVYQTDDAGNLIGDVMADQSPLERNVWLIPAGAVTLAPPLTWPDNRWPRWNGTKWILVPKAVEADRSAAVEKLKAFLRENPDVVAVIDQGGV